MKIKGTFNVELPVQLTPEEKGAKGLELAAAVDAWRRAEDEERERKKLAKAGIDAARDKALHLSNAVHTGLEVRAVPCQRVPDLGRGVWETVRQDSMEVVSTSSMTAEERRKAAQIDLEDWLEEAQRPQEAP